MTANAAKPYAVIGTLLLVAGIVLGFIPQSAQGVGCGSVFRASDEADVQDFTDAIVADSQGTTLDGVGTHAAACDDRRSVYRPIVWLMLVAGVGLWIAYAIMRPHPTSDSPSVEPGHG